MRLEQSIKVSQGQYKPIDSKNDYLDRIILGYPSNPLKRAYNRLKAINYPKQAILKGIAQYYA